MRIFMKVIGAIDKQFMERNRVGKLSDMYLPRTSSLRVKMQKICLKEAKWEFARYLYLWNKLSILDKDSWILS